MQAPAISRLCRAETHVLLPFTGSVEPLRRVAPSNLFGGEFMWVPDVHIYPILLRSFYCQNCHEFYSMIAGYASSTTTAVP